MPCSRYAIANPGRTRWRWVSSGNILLSVVCSAVAMASTLPRTRQEIDTMPSFARYRVPGQCTQAVQRLYHQYWRDQRPDTVIYAPRTDTLPKRVVVAARTCAARFTGATVAQMELLNLAELYLWANQDASAEQVLERWLRSESAPSVLPLGWSRQLLITRLLRAHPARIVLAQKYVAQLDAFGAPAALARFFSHRDMAQYAFAVDDRHMALMEVRAALAASQVMRTPDHIDWAYAIADVYALLAKSLALQDHRMAALTLFDSAQMVLLPLRPSGSVDQAQFQRYLDLLRRPYTVLAAQALPQVHATRWYGPGENRDTIYPRRGRLSLLVFADGSCGDGCYPMYAILRRLYQTLGPRGLDIVLLTSTHGYFREQPMPSSLVEADSTGSYFRTFLRLPAIVAAETTAFVSLPDGRRRNATTANAGAYEYGRGAILIDTHGVVWWLDDLTPQTEATWQAVIREVIP